MIEAAGFGSVQRRPAAFIASADTRAGARYFTGAAVHGELGFAGVAQMVRTARCTE